MLRRGAKQRPTTANVIKARQRKYRNRLAHAELERQQAHNRGISVGELRRRKFAEGMKYREDPVTQAAVIAAFFGRPDDRPGYYRLRY